MGRTRAKREFEKLLENDGVYIIRSALRYYVEHLNGGRWPWRIGFNWLFKQHGRAQTIAPGELIDYPPLSGFNAGVARGARYLFSDKRIL